MPGHFFIYTKQYTSRNSILGDCFHSQSSSNGLITTPRNSTLLQTLFIISQMGSQHVPSWEIFDGEMDISRKDEECLTNSTARYLRRKSNDVVNGRRNGYEGKIYQGFWKLKRQILSKVLDILGFIQQGWKIAVHSRNCIFERMPGNMNAVRVAYINNEECSPSLQNHQNVIISHVISMIEERVTERYHLYRWETFPRFTTVSQCTYLKNAKGHQLFVWASRNYLPVLSNTSILRYPKNMTGVAASFLSNHIRHDISRLNEVFYLTVESNVPVIENRRYTRIKTLQKDR